MVQQYGLREGDANPSHSEYRIMLIPHDQDPVPANTLVLVI
jgi:hypothetical protein